MPEKEGRVQPRRPPPEPERLDLAVIHRDPWLMAVDKPAGMVVHPTYKNWSGTLLNGLLWAIQAGTEGPALQGEKAPRIVTRLDKDTSGVVLVALSAEVHAGMQRDAAAGRITKEYLAIVRGSPPPHGAIDLPLARSPLDRRLVVVDAAGYASRTRYHVVAEANGLALLRCELLTGRTHQLRVHLAAHGWPIVGDAVYGEPHPAISRQALHAWRVTLAHPVSRETLVLEAPLPADMQALAGDAGRRAAEGLSGAAAQERP